ncbi:MSHA pilin protein MshC [Alteromonadaceae bacterium 2753L.S.0a.02]|nr:MSHA pilin protein MshC [Alteromonadaceae bacterium 2753L.S.0a.02]
MELVIVLVLVGILSVSVLGGRAPSKTMQLQSSRDQLVAAFYSAQQLAMARTGNVQLSTGTQIDIRLGGSSVKAGGVQYPISLPANVTLTSASFTFNRLGQTTANTLTLSKNGSSVTVDVESSGYVR